MGLNLCDSCRADCRHERNPREIVIKCGAYKPPMTNADRIRAMSDEELISIHAPLAGRDAPRRRPTPRNTDYNPRAACGARRLFVDREYKPGEFQSPRPLRRATWRSSWR